MEAGQPFCYSYACCNVYEVGLKQIQLIDR